MLVMHIVLYCCILLAIKLLLLLQLVIAWSHDDVIKRRHFLRYCPFLMRIPRWPADSLHRGQWHGAVIFSLICASINSWANNRDVGDLRRHRVYYDVAVMQLPIASPCHQQVRWFTYWLCRLKSVCYYRPTRVLNACATSVGSDDRKCKCIFMSDSNFP